MAHVVVEGITVYLQSTLRFMECVSFSRWQFGYYSSARSSSNALHYLCVWRAEPSRIPRCRKIVIHRIIF